MHDFVTYADQITSSALRPGEASYQPHHSLRGSTAMTESFKRTLERVKYARKAMLFIIGSQAQAFFRLCKDDEMI
jgi:hypothetical protein